jgi:hypothetical protein
LGIKFAVDEAIKNTKNDAKPKEIINYIHKFIDSSISETEIRFTYY